MNGTALTTKTTLNQRITATALLAAMTFAPYAAAGPAPQRPTSPARTATSTVTPRELSFFGPQKYVRTTGPKDVYVATINVPSWLASPFRLHVVNGDPNGTNRVTAGTIDVNGTILVTDADFKQSAASYDRTVTLTSASKLTVTLASQPASFLTINVFGTSADYTAPVLTWVQPSPSSTINTTTPRLLVKYADTLGTGEPAAAGIDTDTLHVTIDDVDRTSLFTRRADEASAQIPSTLALAAGRHTFKANISDLAGNRADIAGEFRVDLVTPSINVVEPAAASYLATRNPAIRIHYQDDVALSLPSLHVSLNDSDITPLFTRSDSEAVIAWPAGMLLPEGPNRLTATIQDLGGNPATTTIAFNADVKAPQIAIAAPANGSRIGSKDAAVTITYSDDQALALPTATATIDGNAVTITAANGQATAQLTGLADGSHTLFARIADRAGNASTATSAFTVDTTVPTIHVVEPPAGAKLKTSTPDVALTYSDNDGVDAATLKVAINSVDRTSLFMRSNASAAATISGFNLPEGVNEISAEIRDVTANLGKTISSFLVDTVAPTGTIDGPADRVTTVAPAATVHYSDANSGIDPTSVHVFVDGSDRTALVTATTEVASGVLATQPPLLDGQHTIRVTFADQAGNFTTLSKSFVIDSHPPQLAVVSPANDAFINTAAPAIRITYSDPQGTGVDLTSFKLSLQKGSDPEADVSTYVTAGPLEATGIVPDASKLSDGTYHLHALIRDVAGNLSTAESSFEIDTIAPVYVIESPAANGYVASATPPLIIRYDDELSGVDTSRIVVLIDGVDRTARFTFADGVATGTLQASEALTQGRHSIQVTVVDRAGNRAAVTPQTFTVDTIAPTAAVESPVMGSYVGKAPHNVSVTYGDGTGSGVDPASVKVTIDGADRTGEFTVGAARAAATIATQLADGTHTLAVSVLDWAGNPATAASTFTVDAIDPVVKITTPLADVWLKGPTITVSGTATDASPTVVEVNGLPAVLSAGAFSSTIPTTEGSLTIHVLAHDAAGNTGTADVHVSVDSVAPVITVSEPAAALVTSKSTIHLAGSVADASAVTLTLNGQAVALASNAFVADLQLTAEGTNAFALVATDAAGNSSNKTVTVTRDTIAPVVAVASPVKSSVIGTLPVVVRGTATDASTVTVTVDGVAATVTGEAWQASIPGLTEGPHTFAIQATDAAGNTASAQQDVTIDLNAPIVVIATPLAGALTKDATSTITGTVTDVSLVSVKASGIDATLVAGSNPNDKTFTFAGVPLAEGDNTLHVIATDAIARSTDKTVLVTRDSTPPVLTVAGPDQVTRSRSAHLVATATDNLAIKDVAFKLGTTELARLTTAPFAYDFTAPLTAAVGDTLTVTVIATDTAGNTSTISKSIRLIAEGALTGQVLSDVTGQPIAGARVRLSGSASSETVTDARGRYAFPVNDQSVVLSIDGTILGSPTTTVERVVTIQSGVGTVPVDARLTPVGARATVTSAGGVMHAGNVTVTVPANAVSSATTMYLTPLSAQGLPNLLPLGWAPLAAFNVSADGALAAPLPFDATISSVATPVMHLAFYKSATHAWTMSQAGVTAVAGSVHVSLPELGSYALVIADDNTVPVAANGAVLTGVAMVAIPDSATSIGSVNPPTLPPTGGSAVGTLTVKSATPLPSGTIVQASVTETFSLSTGETASEETRTEDLVLYRNGLDLTASFPIVPTRTFAGGELVEGTVHLDILAGREAVRGTTGGGNQAVTLAAGSVNVTVASGSLPNDVAIVATPAILSSFLPSSAAASPFAEVVLDFSGFTLSASAQLSASSAVLNASDTVVIARVERVNGVPRVVVVAAADRSGDRVVSRDLTGFAGIHAGGRYVFYRIGIPWSTVAGTVGLGFGSSSAIVQADGFPFTAITNGQGQFNAIAPVGTAHFVASVPGTSLSGSATAPVVSGQTASVSFGLAPAVTSATVTPANGAIRVPVSTQIEINATAPFKTTSANLLTLQLRKSNGDLVPSSYIFSSSGRVLAIVPASALDAGETYTLSVNGLTDIYGGAVAIAPVTFTTQPDTPPNYDTNKIVFTMPDAGGLVTVSAPAGSLPSGTRIVIVNSGNGVVVSYTAGNDGSFTGSFPAGISDRLLITITDPKGNVVNFEKSQYVATDGSGRVAIGPGGGVVQGAGGVELRIPDGALQSGVIFKVEAFGPEKYPERPNFPEAHFGSGLTITSQQKPSLAKEGKLAFPKPADAPDGAFYYVYKRMTGPNGLVAFETIDHAFLGPDGKVVTASYPFIGWNDSVSSWEQTSNAQSVGFGVAADIVMYMMWSNDALRPAGALPGLITGKVLRTKWLPGATQPVYEPIAGAAVTGTADGRSLLLSPSGSVDVALSQEDGTFALWDRYYVGGAVQLNATIPAPAGADPSAYTQTITAFEASPVDKQTFFTTLFQHYRNVATASFTFPPLALPPPAPDVEVHLMKLTTERQREEISGFTIAGVPLIIGFKVNNGASVNLQSVEIGGVSLPVGTDPTGTTEGMPMDYRVVDTYTPVNAGAYTVHATAVNPLGGAPVEIVNTFVALSSGSANDANTVNLPGAAPDVITSLVSPADGEEGVSTDSFATVVFTEPVVNVAKNLRMVEEPHVDDDSTAIIVCPCDLPGCAQTAPCRTGGSQTSAKLSIISNATGSDQDVPIVISAVAVDANGHLIPIPDLAAQADNTAVVSVTIRAPRGLKLSNYYKILLGDGITDLDKDATGAPKPKSLTPRQYRWKTIKPVGIGHTEAFPSPGMVVFDNYAFAARRETSPDGSSINDLHGFLSVYDFRNPLVPVELAGAKRAVVGQPMDISGEEKSPVNNNGAVVAMVTGGAFTLQSPSNFYLFDVHDPESPRQIAAVSLTESTQDGIATRVVTHKNRAFAATFPRGLQTIDLDRAVAEYAEAELDPRKRQERSLALVTSGMGWGGDAASAFVIRSEAGFIAHLLDLGVADYVVNGVPNTVVLGTGTIPLVVFNSDNNAVLFRKQSVASTEGDLTFGVALGQDDIAGRHIVVVAGTGSGRDANNQLVTGPVLVVFDMTNPAAPAIVGSIALPVNPTDLVVSNNPDTNDHRVYVATDTGFAYVVGLNDPTHPRDMGKIENVSRRLARSNTDLLLSTSQGLTDGTNGIHTTVVHPVVLIDPVLPIQTVIDTADGTLTAPQKVHVKEDVALRIQVIPTIKTKTGQLTIKNARVLDGTDVTAAPITINYDTSGVSKSIVIPAGYYEDTELRLSATAVQGNGSTLKSAESRVKLGWVKLTVDANNNTLIEAADHDAQRKGRIFAFWESDPDYDSRSLYSHYATTVTGIDPSGTHSTTTTTYDADKRSAAVRGLADYFTIKIHVNREWKSKDHPNAQVRLRLVAKNGDAADSVWWIARKTSSGTDYLSDMESSYKTLADIGGDDPTAPTAPCAPTSSAKLNPNNAECGTDTLGSLVLPDLTVGDYEFLVKCSYCRTDSPTDPAGIKRFSLQYSTDPSDVTGARIDSATLELRPTKHWMTIYSARTGGPQPTSKFYKFPGANNPDPPANARTVTVGVHGYNVAHPAAVASLTTYMKRLYWVGQKVLRRQGDETAAYDDQGCAGGCAYFIGASWPSDNVVPNQNDHFSAFDPAGYFPDDEFSALQTGIPFARLIRDLKSQNSNRTINVIAHSLGNMVVNSALTRVGRELHAGDITTYIMNEPALAAEAYDTGNVAAPYNIFSAENASKYGWPDDARWKNEWADIRAGIPHLQTPLGDGTYGDGGPDYSDRNRWDQFMTDDRARALKPDAPVYERRWNQQRPHNGDGGAVNDSVPDNAVSGTQRGPWKGFFALNPTRTNIFNTYNLNDLAVTYIWMGCQTFLKPYYGDFGLLPDNRKTMFWALLKNTGSQSEALWDNVGDHSNITRQWAELAFWYPALSDATGYAAVEALELPQAKTTDPRSRNRDFTSYGTGPYTHDPLGHSYMHAGDFFSVFKAWQEYKSILNP